MEVLRPGCRLTGAFCVSLTSLIFVNMQNVVSYDSSTFKKSTVQKATLDPVWNENFELYVYIPRPPPPPLSCLPPAPCLRLVHVHSDGIAK